MNICMFFFANMHVGKVPSPASYPPYRQRHSPLFSWSKIRIEYIEMFKRDYLANGDR